MKLRIGLAGCGIISGAHLDGYAALSDQAEVVAVADRDVERARQAAAKAGAARVYAGFEELIADPELDAVDLCLPHHLHRPATLAALAAGKHVLCQKPIATTLEDADAMIAAAAQNDRVFMVAETMRFHPAVERARELIAAGLIGEPILAQSVSAIYQGGPYLETPWRFVPDEMGGGALIDGGIHFTDALLNLLGRPARVSCLTRRVRPIFPTEDTAIVQAQFESGVLLNLTVMWSARHTPSMLFRISGTEGTLTVEWGRITVESDKLPDGKAEYPSLRAQSFALMVAHFVECARTGRQPRMGGAEARADLEFVLAAYESARTGRVVEIPASAGPPGR